MFHQGGCEHHDDVIAIDDASITAIIAATTFDLVAVSVIVRHCILLY